MKNVQIVENVKKHVHATLFCKIRMQMYQSAAGMIGFVAFKGIQKSAASDKQMLKISVDGEVCGEYSLKDKQEIKIGDTNVCQIEEDGTVSMTEADCPDQLCVKQGKIKAFGESIICLPNKVVLEIVTENKKAEEIDSIVK